MADLWEKRSGTELAVLQERNTTVVPLPLNNDEIDDSTSLTVQKISGTLPNGMRLETLDSSLYTVKYGLVGTPLEVPRSTQYKFVLRATQGELFQDRTFTITVEGPDEPEWVTSEGLLPIGENSTFYILDSAPVDFQLVAVDRDTSAGQTLEYFIANNDGQLPPGIELTSDGRLVGIVDPILALDKAAGAGLYDQNVYGTYPYDFGIKSSNGFDSFFYDTTTYDLSIPTRSPKKLNRYYEFVVSVSDGDTIARRTFRIFVVGDDFLRADNTIMQVGTGTFTADNTHIRTPIWLTPRDFGYRRANNYVTLFLDVIDPNSLSGVVSYSLETINDDGSDSILPPGLVLDSTTGEIAGRVPYQPAVTTEYKFTVKASRLGATVEKTSLSFRTYEDTAIGSTSVKIDKNPNVNSFPGNTINVDGNAYRITSVNDAVNQYDTITLGEPVDFKVFETATTGSTQVKITPVGNLLSDLVGETISFGTSSYTVSNVDDGSIIYAARIDHTSQAGFLQDDDKWEVYTGSETEATVWTPGTPYQEGDLVKYSTRGYDVLTFTSAITSNISLGLPIEHVIPVETKTLWKVGTIVYLDAVSYGLNTEVAEKSKTFIVRMLGEVDSTISWLTPSDLGNISSNYISTLKVEAQTTVPNGKLLYSLIKGTLPPGLTLSPDGEIIGKINSFGTVSNPGLTIFDSQTLILDGNTTSIDRDFRFTIKAQDQFGFSAIEQEFVVNVDDPDDKLYSNLYVKPMLKESQRSIYNTFISNPDVFDPNYIYRPNDPNFGLQKQIKMLVYAGIETKSAENYVAAAAKNHTRKRFRLGDVKTAVAKLPGTNDIVYEVVYVDIIDPYEPSEGTTKQFYKINNKNRLKTNSISYSTADDNTGLQNEEPMRFRPPEPNTVKADSDVYKISQLTDDVRYISNLTNMRENILGIGDTERNFLPLWMRTSQGTNIAELGFVSAIPLCYCKPGTSQIIANAIKNTEFEFNQFDFDIDRYIIDSTEGNSAEQYIVFANYKFNV